MNTQNTRRTPSGTLTKTSNTRHVVSDAHIIIVVNIHAILTYQTKEIDRGKTKFHREGGDRTRPTSASPIATRIHQGVVITENSLSPFYTLPRITREERLQQIRQANELPKHPFENHGGLLSRALYEIQGWNGSGRLSLNVANMDSREIKYTSKELHKLGWFVTIEGDDDFVKIRMMHIF